MHRYDFELRLLHLKSGVENGAIRLADLAKIAAALQELNTRIARTVFDQTGPGRTKEAGSSVAQLRLTGITEGSTRLHVGFGENEMLDTPGFYQQQDETASKFWEVVDGVRTGNRPEWATNSIAESALELISSMSLAAHGAHFTSGQYEVTFESFRIPREPWRSNNDAASRADVTVTGRLYAVNTETRTFRIRDDAGNSIPLDDVQNLDAAASLVNDRAQATGIARFKDGVIRSLSGVIVGRAELPSAWFAVPAGTPWSEILESSDLGPGPDPAGIPGVSDADVDDLLALIHG